MAKQSNNKINNPLAVIGVFAGIAEIAMTVVLFKLPETLQEVFIWFVMVFPFFLVGLFFLILYKKPAAFFSPSDYRKDSSYLESISEAKEFSDIKASIAELNEGLQTVKTYSEKILQNDEFNMGDVVDAENERLTEAHSWRTLLQNSFVAHLVNEFKLGKDQVYEVLAADDVNALIETTYRITADNAKKERLERLLQAFPKTYIDFEKAKSLILQDGDI